MPTIKDPGRYDATVHAMEFGESRNGTPFLRLDFTTTEGETIAGWLYLSEKALPNTVETLKKAFDFNGDFTSLELKDRECSIVCEIEEDDKGNERLRVKWINARQEKRPIANQQSFLQALTEKAARIPPKAPKAAAPAKKAASKVDDKDVPF